MKMNKTKFIEELKNKLNYNKTQCEIINSIVEDTFLIGKKNKDKMITKFQSELNISIEESNIVYETIMDIIKCSLKEKIKHSFNNLDE